MKNATFIYVGLPTALERFGRLGWFHYAYYFLWQVRAFCAARRLHRKVGLDIVHHVTYVNSWLPSFMGWLSIPFIWSAGLDTRTPWVFLRDMSWRARFQEIVRNVAVAVFGWLTYLCTARRASVILACAYSRGAARAGVVRRMAVGGLPSAEIDALAAQGGLRTGTFRILSVGRLLGGKGFGMGLRAFARLHRDFPGSEYWIVGEGPERRFLERLAARLGCAEAVRFWGWLPRHKVLELLSEVHVLLHPSLHEQFGYVLLEAMAAGKPVVCLDIGGPSILVGDGCGFKIPAMHPNQVVSEVHRALYRLASDPELRTHMGQTARTRAAEKWSCEAVGAELIRLYSECCAAERATGGK